MEDRKLPSLSEYDDEFSKSGEKDFYAFIDRKKQEALANGDQELAEHLEKISNQAYEEQKEYDEILQAEYEREEKEKRKQREAEYYDDYYQEETAELEEHDDSVGREPEEIVQEDKNVDIRSRVIKKIQSLIANGENPSNIEVQLSEEEHDVFMEMIAHNPYMQQNNNYMKDTYRREYDDESYYHDATPEEQAEYDRTNGNDYISIRIGEKLFLNEDFNRYRRTSSIKLENARLHGDGDHEYGEEEFDIAEIITPEDLIEGMKDKTKDLSSLSVEELQEIVSGNNEQISLNEEEIKQALIQRILEQQQTIARQKEEISRLNSQKEL